MLCGGEHLAEGCHKLLQPLTFEDSMVFALNVDRFQVSAGQVTPSRFQANLVPIRAEQGDSYGAWAREVLAYQLPEV
ncbi:MAG: hypothetical protein EB034_26485 [Verrucomicrobia bacterium]|nr:hypothetical protein [Verrucomicrobiota bacterium]